MKSIRSILHILLGVTLICSCNEATELAHITPNVSLIKYKDIVKIDSLYTYPGDSLYQNWINQYNKNLEDKTSRSLSPEDDAFFNKQYIVKSTEATVLYGKNGKFEAEGKVIYIEDTKTHTFRAYYPYNAVGGILTATTDATAQQNQPAIDFLFASGATGDKNNPVVSFTDKTAKGGEDNSFHHRMSQITLTFEAGDGVNFSVVKPERYTLDGLLLIGTFNTADGIATADNGLQTGELTMNLADGNLTSSIILFPQTVASLPLVVNYKGQEYHATLTMPDGALLAGNNYTYTVKVSNKVLEVSEATIAKWNDIDGGDVGADL